VTDSVFDALGTVQSRGSYDVVGGVPRFSRNPNAVRQAPSTTPPPVVVVRRSALDALRTPGQTADIRIATESFESPSVNIIGEVRGTDPKLRNEYVVFSSHQDHDGVRFPVNGDSIWNGADDNASTSVALLAIARAWVKQPSKRSALFIFHGAEERGLLGSEIYAIHPVYPAAKTVANITLDILQTGGPARDVMLVGQGQNSLETALARAAAAQGRVVTPETLPERGLFYRADHFSLAKHGVPTLLFMAISGAPDLKEGGREAGQRWLDEYMRCYHQTCDAWSEQMDFEAAAQDVALAYAVGRDLAFSGDWPEWSAGSEFRQVREQSKTH